MGKKYEEVTKNILQGLSEFKKDYFEQSYYYEFENRVDSMEKAIQASLEEGRLLKIGIVGEVKAGKSSFLNALLFDGKDILPKASTPMTAALTKIKYSKKSSAKIVFYDEKDWEKIEKYSADYDSKFDEYYNNENAKHMKRQSYLSLGGTTGTMQPVQPLSKNTAKQLFNKTVSSQLLSCKELTEKFDNSSIDLTEFLGNTREVPIDGDVQSCLNNYIGADGEYTAIVDYVELQINNEALKEVEIVDTPGLDDPIVSRTETTKRFLNECDVVFLLSYTGQFLTQKDISFMCETLPNEGIRECVVIGSKFDSGLLDDNKSKDIRTACRSSMLTYNKQASENIRKCLSNGYNFEVLSKIQKKDPSYISSRLYSCYTKKRDGLPYTKDEQNTIDQLKRHFDDFEDNEKMLLSLSGFNSLKKNEIIPIIERKQEIISKKNKETLSDNKKKLLQILDSINDQVLQNSEKIDSCEKEELTKNLHLLQSKLNSLRREVRNVFERTAVDAVKFLNNMKTDIDSEIDNYINFNVKTESHTERDVYGVGFFGLRKEIVMREVTTYNASISDVIANIRKYINRCKRLANDEFEKVVNISKLEKEVKEIIIGAYDLSDKSFNERDILVPLEIVIKKIQIPKIEIDIKDYEKLIIDSFSSPSVNGAEIEQLKLVENSVLSTASKKIKDDIDECGRKLEEIMVTESATFVDSVINQLTTNVEMLRRQIDNKEDAIRQNQTLCKALVQYKKIISEMEI